MITASLATYPARYAQLKQTVASLIPQVDRINVWLNGYDVVPEYLMYVEKALVGFGGNLGDAGKFYWAGETEDYLLICDDDIIYPPDYAATMVKAVDKYNRRAVVGLHGVWIKEPVTSYYRDRDKINAACGVDADIPCHMLATNSIAFHSSTLKINPPRDFPIPNYADPLFAVLTQKQRVPCVCIARPAGWIQHIKVTESLYDKFSKGDDAIHTKIVQLLSPWYMFQP
jgi:hypothetical protein